MKTIEIPINLKKIDKKSKDHEILTEIEALRRTTSLLASEERYIDAMERTVEGLRTLRGFSNFENHEFRALLVGLLFDLAELHFRLKDYKQAEKEIEVIFKVVENLIREDSERFGKYHLLAMELSTRILRSRKKTMELLVKQQINTGVLYEKVNAGVIAATDKLVDSLRNVGELLASTGDYRASLKFYAEAIKLSKKRAGKVTLREIRMTIDMAKIMNRISHLRPRAIRLLEAVLPHAISQGSIELEEDILAMMEIINKEESQESAWKNFLHRVQKEAKARFSKKKKENPEPENTEKE